MNKFMRDLVGYISTGLGAVLLASTLYLGGSPDIKLSRSSRILAMTGTGITGGALTFGVGRRMLTERVDGTREQDSDQGEG